MKVLYLGVYKDGTGWGNAAIDYILALDAVDVDVVPRAIRLSANEQPVPQRILELEDQSDKGCDICIQHILPDMMDYRGEFDKCIGIYAAETSNMFCSNWTEHLNTMDESWVINREMEKAARDSFVYNHIEVVPHTFDVSKYSQRAEPYPLPGVDNKFCFYFIGEITRRKNLPALLKAFHLEFGPDEQVALIIKANLSGVSPAECGRHVREMTRKIKEGLKLYPDLMDYHNEIIITQRLTDDELLRLHHTGDCFVMPSFGEGFCIPAFDAMALGKTPICTNQGGPSDFLEAGGGVLVEGTSEPVFGMTEGCGLDLFNGREDWQSISLNGLRNAMRLMYENQDMRKTISRKGIETAWCYSHTNAGMDMKELLERPTPEKVRFPKVFDIGAINGQSS